MAAASDDEEMNYWPGFVDALSTMTMMLIFLMLILSLVVISISQNVSRTQVMAIAKAAKVDVSGTPASLENISAQIISALARLSNPDEPGAPVPEKRPQEETVLVEPSAKIKAAERPNMAVEPGDKVVVSGMADAAISNGRSTITPSGPDVDESSKPASNPPESSQIAALEPNSGPEAFALAEQKTPQSRIVSTQPADLAPFGGDVDVNVSKATLTLVYQSRAMRLDDVAKKKLADFIETNRDQLSVRPFRIQALANVTHGNVSDARRFAYYRAMTLRQILIENSIPAKAIALTISDVQSDQNEDIVELIAN